MKYKIELNEDQIEFLKNIILKIKFDDDFSTNTQDEILKIIEKIKQDEIINNSPIKEYKTGGIYAKIKNKKQY